MKKIIESLRFLKKELKALFLNKKNLLIVLYIFISFSFIVFLSFSVYGSWWKFWPKNIRSYIAINRLALSVYRNQPCRDFCYFEQLDYEREIKTNLNNKRIFNRLTKIVFNDNDNLNWRLRSLNIISQNRNDYLKEFLNQAQIYIKKDGGDYQIKESLILSFEQELDYHNYLESLKENLLRDSLNQDKITSSLIFISQFDYNYFDFYLNLLNKSEKKEVTKLILSSMGSDPNRFTWDREEYLSVLKRIFLENNQNFEVRKLVIFIISDYLTANQDDLSFKILNDFYLNEKIDKFSKFLIADILNKFSGKNYDYPNINNEEWKLYHGSF